ncbi:MAG: alpha/beta fold hydrolase [Proteobacteria bacterium]|nr:alpha/beta fold hydrolase [Pseudomonadota bacterium]
MISPLSRKPATLPVSSSWSITKDGVTLNGRFHPSKNNSKHLIVIFHGLGGHIHSAYVMGVTASLINLGFSVLRVSLRGGDDDSPHTYHANQIGDIDWVVDHLHSQGHKVSLMGFSLSASMILKWLEHERNIETALLVSPPLDLDKCVQKLDHRGNKLYQKYFLKKLRVLLERKKIKNPDLFLPYMVPETFMSIRGFDSNFTAKRNGFSSAEEYYKKSSPTEFEKIQNRICIIHSKDDPIIGHEELLKVKNLNKPNIEINLTNYGGHVGFYQGLGHGYMVDRWASEYFEKLLLQPSKV